ncbi:MAG: twin-arginine translocation signal domain-containing protein [Candidatus Scalindua sp.]|nr:twin-arginine translocation signal domain-containing protein [Candidatus Scalindua sp.]
MSNRREFMKTTAAIAVGAVVGNVSPVMAAGSCSFPAGIVYSSEKPGKWSGKEKGHAPVVTVEGNKVTVTTKHGMSDAHYIVRHTVVSQDGEVIGEKTFSSSDTEAKSEFELPGGVSRYAWVRSTLYATSFCNLHDLWVTQFKA